MVDRHEVKALVAPLSQQLASIRSDLDTVIAGQSTSQLNNASITGSIKVMDTDGVTVLGSIGGINGSAGIATITGPVPPVPATVTLTPGPLSLTVQWNGTTNGEDAWPVDFSHVEIHMSDTGSFTPDAGTMVGVFTKADQKVISPLEPVLKFVKLVAVSLANVKSDPGQEVSATPGPAVDPGSITQTEIADDSISTPKLQALAVTGDKIAANTITAGNIQAGSIDADAFAAKIVVANDFIAGNETMSHLTFSGDGLVAYATDGTTKTLNVKAADGSVSMLGTLSTGISGRRIIINPTSASLPEIDFYPLEGNAFSAIYSTDGDWSDEVDLHIKTGQNNAATCYSDSMFAAGTIELSVRDLSNNNEIVDLTVDENAIFLNGHNRSTGFIQKSLFVDGNEMVLATNDRIQFAGITPSDPDNVAYGTFADLTTDGKFSCADFAQYNGLAGWHDLVIADDWQNRSGYATAQSKLIPGNMILMKFELTLKTGRVSPIDGSEIIGLDGNHWPTKNVSIACTTNAGTNGTPTMVIGTDGLGRIYNVNGRGISNLSFEGCYFL